MMNLRLKLRETVLAETDGLLGDLKRSGAIQERLGILPTRLKEVQSELNALRSTSRSGDGGPAGLGLISSVRKALQPEQQRPEPEEEKGSQEVGKLGRRRYEPPEPGRSSVV